MLAKKYRLTKHGSFNYVYRNGRRLHSGQLTMSFVRGGKGVKIGFSVPNKVGKATVRNKLKRRMRALMHGQTDKLCPSQIVFSAAKGADEKSFDELKVAMEGLVKKSGLLK